MSQTFMPTVRYVSTDSPITQSEAGEPRRGRKDEFREAKDFPGSVTSAWKRARGISVFSRIDGFLGRNSNRWRCRSRQSEQAVGRQSPSEILARSGIVLRGTRVPALSYRGIAGIPCIPRSCITIANKRPLFGSVARSTGSLLRLCRFHQISGGYVPLFLAPALPPLAAFYLCRYLCLVA